LALQEFFPNHRPVFVFGASGDHPFEDALRELLPVAHQTLVTRSRHPRAAQPETLAQTIANLGYESSVTSSVSSALQTALQKVDSQDLICVTGSIFTVADARQAWREQNGLPLPPLDPEVEV
jgi:dihydrofolate synthase/folylpolyglutamate synthase